MSVRNIALIALIVLPQLVAAQVIFPNRGGTGTSTIPTFGQVLMGRSDGTYGPVATSSLGITGGVGGGSGTVTSVGLTMPTGFTVTGTPVTTADDFVVAFAAGYTPVLTSSTTQWSSFYDTPSSRITAGNHIDWSGNTLNVVTTGDWSGTFDGYEGSQLLGMSNWLYNGSRLSPSSTVGIYVAASSTITNFNSTWSTTTAATSTNLYSWNARFGSSTLGYASSTALTVSGNTYLGSLSGILKGTSGLVGTAANGTDYTLISGTTCPGSDKVSAISASGAVTCSADLSGSGGGSTTTINNVQGPTFTFNSSSTALSYSTTTGIVTLNLSTSTLISQLTPFLLGTSSALNAGEAVFATGARTLASVATGTLTETVSGLQFDATRGLFGGSAVLSLSAGFTIPTTSSTTEWGRAYSSTTALNATSPLTYTGTTGNLSIQVANGSQNGYLSSSDWTLFNNKVSSTSIDTSAELAALLGDETGTGSSVFSASPTFTGTAVFNQINTAGLNVTSSSTLGYASTTALTVSGNTVLAAATSTTLGVTSLNAANCDLKATTNGFVYCGLDVTGSGGVGIATSGPIADTEVIYGTSVGTVDSEAAFTYNATTDVLTVTNLTSTNATATTQRITNLALGSDVITDLTGTGLQNTAGALTLNATGDWTGTLDGFEGATLAQTNWLYNGSRLSPSSTVGIGVFASSTLTDLNFTNATGTNATTTNFRTTQLGVGSDYITDITGTGIALSGSSLTATLGTDITAGEIANGDHGFFSYSGGVASLDTGGLTSANLSGALTDETGTGNAVFSASPTFTGTSIFNQVNTAGITVTGSSTLGYASTTALTVSGNTILASATATNIASTLSTTSVFYGAGLTDCDTGATSKLLWDVTTGKFSCGTDQTGGVGGSSNWTYNGSRLSPSTTVGIGVFASSTIGNGTGSGGLTISGNATSSGKFITSLQDASGVRYALTQLDGTNDTGLGAEAGLYEMALYHRGAQQLTFDGITVDAHVPIWGLQGFYSYGGASSSFSGPTYFNSYSSPNGSTTNSTSTNLASTFSTTSVFYGAGLTDCDTGASSKLLWDATTGKFSCGTDQNSGGSGASDWNQSLGSYLTPSTTVGIRVSASSTIGDGTLSTQLTIAGNASTTGRFQVGTSSDFASNGPASGFGNLSSVCNNCGASGGNLLTIGQYGTGPSGINSFSARGSSASPSATQSGDDLYFMGARGYGATVWNNGSKGLINIEASENYTDSANGTRIVFEVTPNLSTTRGEAMRLENTGFLGIGSTTPSRQLTVAGNAIFANTWATGTASSTYASTSRLTLSGSLFDRTNSAGTSGMVLQTNGSGATWVATSTLGFRSNWTYNGSRLTPSSTIGIGVFASSTIGGGTGATGLTISGNATATKDIVVGAAIRVDGIPNTDNTYSGVSTDAFTAGTSSIARWDLLMMFSNGSLYQTDADDAASTSGMLALAGEAGTSGSRMQIVMPGSYVRNDAWSWATGTVLYASTTPGAITTTVPSGTDDVVRVVGFAVTADVIYFMPESGYLTRT